MLVPEKVTLRSILTLALPIVAQLVMNGLVTLCDRAMLGNYSTFALASMRITSPLLWCIQGVASAFTIGVMAVAGRAIGGQQSRLAGAVGRSCLGLALFLGTVVGCAALSGLPPLLRSLLMIDHAVADATWSYLIWLLPALPLELMADAAAALLQTAGDSRTPFLVSTLANFINAVVDYALIFGHWGCPELGVQGAAIGSAVAILLRAVLLISWLWSGQLGLSLRGWGGEIAALTKVLRISAPTFVERLFRSLGYLGFSTLLLVVGEVAMAAHECILAMEELFYYVAEGLGIAGAAIVAQQLGAGRPREAIRAMQGTLGLALTAHGVASLLFWLIPGWLLRLFSTDPQVLQMGVPALYITAIAQPFMGTSLVLESILRGAGDTTTAFWISLGGWFVVRLTATVILVLVYNNGLLGIWLGSTADWLVRAALLIWIIRRGRWYTVQI